MPHGAAGPLLYRSVVLFGFVALTAAFGLPAFAYFYDYTRLDRVTFGFLSIITGLGSTIGYHRLVAHCSFACRTRFLVQPLRLGLSQRPYVVATCTSRLRQDPVVMWQHRY